MTELDRLIALLLEQSPQVLPLPRTEPEVESRIEESRPDATGAARMDSETVREVVIREVLLKEVPAASGDSVSGAQNVSSASLHARNTTAPEPASQLDQFTAQLHVLREAQLQLAVLDPSPVVASRVEESSADQESGFLGKLGESLVRPFQSGLGIAPLITGLLGMFGGGREETPVPLPAYSLPDAVRLEAGLTSDRQVVPVSYGQGETARTVSQPSQTQQGIQITVNALDSRSFMDRGDDIARAVKEAMLNSHSLIDVVVDL